MEIKKTLIKNKQITIPQNFSEKLAEETGIHIGDGSMNKYIHKQTTRWVYTFSSHKNDDKKYIDYVLKLMEDLYAKSPYIYTKNNCINLIYCSKEIVVFKKNLGLPMGKKINIIIPKWIFKEKEFIKKCVRGIVDTDGSLRFRKPFKSKIHSYPSLKVSNNSEPLIQQINNIFLDFGLTPSINIEGIKIRRPNKLYNVNLNGVKNLEKYIKIFGFSNYKHFKKYLFWKKNGYYLPKYKSGGEGI
tara:strand:- start:5198 stop:5929 length:732 start_codon:yes stop_codon:yes gene_type:complete